MARPRRRPRSVSRAGGRRSAGRGAARHRRGPASGAARFACRGRGLLHADPAVHPVVRHRTQGASRGGGGAAGDGRRHRTRGVSGALDTGGARRRRVAAVRGQPAAGRPVARGPHRPGRSRRGVAAHRALRAGPPRAAGRARHRRVHGPRDPAAGAGPPRRGSAGDGAVQVGRRGGLRRRRDTHARRVAPPLRPGDRLVGISVSRRASAQPGQPAQQRPHSPAGRALRQFRVRAVGPGRCRHVEVRPAAPGATGEFAQE